MAAIFFACCSRGKTKRGRTQGHDERVIPDEESRLIPTTIEQQLVLPDAVAEELERRKARLSEIVRAKSENMISTYSPFNNRYSPQRYGANGNGRSMSRSLSRDPSSAIARYGQNHNRYGTLGAQNPTLAHTMSMPSPLAPEQSEMQVQIPSAAEGRTSVDRNGSRREIRSGSSEGGLANTGVKTGIETNPAHIRPSLVMSPSSSSIAKSVSTPRGSMSDSNGDETPKKGGGLGVRLIRPVSPTPMAGYIDRRGRPKVKAGGNLSSPTGFVDTWASSNSLAISADSAIQSDPSSLEQTPRPLNGFPTTMIPPPVTVAPPSSPQYEHFRETTPKIGKKAPPIFEIKDMGELTIDWDD